MSCSATLGARAGAPVAPMATAALDNLTNHLSGPPPPTFFVHAEDDQPEDHCCRSEQSEGCNIEEHTVSEWRIQESQPAQSSKHRQDAQNARQEGGSENQVAV